MGKGTWELGGIGLVLGMTLDGHILWCTTWEEGIRGPYPCAQPTSAPQELAPTPTCISPHRLEECMLTGACCASLASVLTSSKTLKKINLLGNNLGDEGIVRLLEALGHPECVLHTVG